MSIYQLSQETVDELCSALEKGRTIDWKRLMNKGFSTIYSEDDVALIESSTGFHPAKALLYDLAHREVALQDLVNGLKVIGNNKAVSIIMKGTWSPPLLSSPLLSSPLLSSPLLSSPLLSSPLLSSPLLSSPLLSSPLLSSPLPSSPLLSISGT